MVVVPFLCVSGVAQAAGFQLNEHSASGLGRAFAGEGAIGDNASVLARNPAAMTLFDKSEVSVAASYIDPNVDVSGTTIYPSLNPKKTATEVSANEKDIAPSAVVPAFYYIKPLSEQWSVGVAAFSNYGFTTDYGDAFSASELANYSEIATFTVNPNIAYRINEQWSLGAGLDITYGEAKLETTGSDALGGIFKGDTMFGLEGDDTAYSWNVGALYELSPQTRFGLTYRSEVDMEFEGDGSIAGAPKSGSVAVTLPKIAELSAYHELNNQWAIHGSVMYSGWSSFETLEADIDGSDDPLHLKDEYYDNTWRYSVGTTYRYTDQWTLRTGYALDKGAVSDEHRTLSIPDTDRHLVSVGATYAVSEDLSIDGGYGYLWGDSAPIDETDPITGTSFSGETEGTAHIVSMQMNWRF